MANSFLLHIDSNGIILNPQSEHLYTLIWIHGLNQTPETHLRYLLNQSLVNQFSHFKIVIPKAPKRYLTADKNQFNSWFDIKFRNEKSFIVDFDEAFSSAEVRDSYEKILEPIIQRENVLLKGRPKRIFIGGFSQGGGMAYHCLYSTNIELAGIIGISGYLFPISHFTESNKTPKILIYGNEDNLRPWKLVKVTYQNKFKESQIILVNQMKHEINIRTIQQIKKFMKDTLKQIE